MIPPTLHIYIGYDDVEEVAYHALCSSIIQHTKAPVAFHPVKQSMIPEYTRARDPKQSNEFSFTRFLVPYLAGYCGWALFMDCDMIVKSDLSELFALRDFTSSVMVCKHDYEPRSDSKYLGAVQYKYPKKNWSSVMLFNCSHFHCRRLTPSYVNVAKGLDLHRFHWTDDHRIGELPLEWNWLVGEYPHNEEAKILHYTEGTPCFREYRNCDHADDWHNQHERLNHSLQYQETKAS